MPIYEPVLILKPDQVFINRTARVDSWTKIEGKAYIGAYVHVASFCHLGIGGGELTLDDYSACSSGSKIVTGSNIIDGISCSAAAPPELQITARSNVYVGKFAIIFSGAIVLPGVRMEEGAALAAGAVLTKSIPPWEIWAGVPAKKIGERHVARERYRLYRQTHKELTGAD